MSKHTHADRYHGNPIITSVWTYCGMSWPKSRETRIKIDAPGLETCKSCQKSRKAQTAWRFGAKP